MLDQDDNFYLSGTMQTTPFSCWFFFHFFLVVFICEIKWLRDIYMHLRFLVYELKQYLYILLCYWLILGTRWFPPFLE